MKKKPQEPLFTLTFNEYLKLFKTSFSNPKSYAESIPLSNRYSQLLLFFIVNFFVLSLGEAIIGAVINRKAGLFFNATDQALFTLPIAVLALFFSTAIFYVIAKVLGGKGTFRDSIAAISYSTLPAVLSFIPFVSIILFLLEIYFLIISFAKIHRFSNTKASVCILLPILILMVLLASLGLVVLPF